MTILIAPHAARSFKVVVQDTGIGIKEEDIAQLFKDFVQLDPSAARRYKGTGLGLSLTQKLVELQGGTISVESEVGKSSSFTVVLPLVSHERRQPLKALRSEPKARLSKLAIGIVYGFSECISDAGPRTSKLRPT